MKRSWFSVLLVLVLFGLLGLLAGLQYRWLGQISDGERDRLEKRLQADTQRFASDFNDEIHKVYFNFQMGVEDWQKKDWAEFNQRLDHWKNNSAYPGLPSDFYLLGVNGECLSYDQNAKSFLPAPLPDEMSGLLEALKKDEGNEPVAENIPALVMPVYQYIESISASPKHLAIDKPQKKYGLLVVKLSKKIIEEEIFPALTRQYFSDGDGANYRLAVADKDDRSQIIFKNYPEEISAAEIPATSDSTAKLLSLSPEKMAFFPDVIDSIKRKQFRSKVEEHGNFVFSQKFEERTSISNKPLEEPAPEQSKTFSVKLVGDEKPRITMLESTKFNQEGAWLLTVQHRDGSLEQFITNTRNRNLGISFGILALLGISVAFVFLSAQRAKRLAQRQMDFVSSVSHEFRTPLAVIYTAGENLTDGVVNSHTQVTEYGTLIKHEGKKLSGMVEQILEFAGARSGKRKYDFRKTNVADVLSDALEECRPLINETGFVVEKNIQAELPEITADGTALSHAFQNLISNAIKYSRDDKRLKITAENGGGTIKLLFEDHGLGIPARERSQIFEPFYRGKEVVAAQIHGNGLGLSLVKQIVEAHNGRVEVESRPGEGSKFTIKLPVQQ